MIYFLRQSFELIVSYIWGSTLTQCLAIHENTVDWVNIYAVYAQDHLMQINYPLAHSHCSFIHTVMKDSINTNTCCCLPRERACFNFLLHVEGHETGEHSRHFSLQTVLLHTDTTIALRQDCNSFPVPTFKLTLFECLNRTYFCYQYSIYSCAISSSSSSSSNHRII